MSINAQPFSPSFKLVDNLQDGQILIFDVSENAFVNAYGDGSGANTTPVTTVLNLGTGLTLSDGVTGNALELKTLVAGSGITLSDNTDSIVISANQVDQIQGATNLGTGAGVLAGITVDNDFQFKSIAAGSGIGITDNGSTITLSVSGSLGQGLYLEISENLADLQDPAAARAALGVMSSTEAQGKFVRTDGHSIPDYDRTWDIGSSQRRFQDIYAETLQGTAVLANNLTISGQPGDLLAYDGQRWIPVSSVPSETPQMLSLDGTNLTISQGNTINLDFVEADIEGLTVEEIGKILVVDTGWKIVPETDGLQSLGTPTNRWSEIYLSNASVYIDGNTLSTSGGNLLWNGQVVQTGTDDLSQYATQTYVNSSITTATTGLASELYVDDELSNALSLYATLTYVDNRFTTLLGAAPEALDTLKELSDALGGDANFAATVTNQLALKANDADLATVATSGDYNDLSNKPTIPTVPTNVSAFTNDANYITLASLSATGDISYNNTTGVISYTAPTDISQLTDTTNLLADIDGLTSDSGNSIVYLDTGWHFLPETDLLQDLGSATKRFRDLYLSGNTIYLDDVTLSTDGTDLFWNNINILDYTSLINKPTKLTDFSNDLTIDYDTLANVPDFSVYETTANVDAKLINYVSTTELTANYASTTYVDDAVASVLGTISTEALDTLGELASAINNDPDYFNTISSGLSTKANTTDLTAEQTARADADTALQTELNTTQTGAGLSATGAYSAIGVYNADTNAGGGHYIGGATSLANADKLLDSALKAVDTAYKAADTTLQTNIDTLDGSLATVAKTGSYNDLTNTPVIPSDVNELSDASGLFWTTDQNEALNSNGDPTFNSLTVNGAVTLLNGAVIKDTVRDAIAFGQDAGTTNQGYRAVAMGAYAGSDTQQNDGLAIGYEAGKTSQGSAAVAIGSYTASSAQGSQATAVGTGAGELSQGTMAVAVGSQAGRDQQGSGAVAVGSQAGDAEQGGGAVAVGPYSGFIAQGSQAVAVGENSGEENQGTMAIAIGVYAGKLNQGADGIAIGHLAGSSGQLEEGIAIGKRAGQTSQGGVTVAIGYEAGKTSQGTWAIAIGPEAGKTSQGQYAVAIGDFSGRNTQGTNAVAVGPSAGYNTQGADAVAIGFSAGTQNQGAGAIAIGYEAGANNQAANSIVINATGVALENTTASSFVVKPVRESVGTTVLMYNATSGEITYSDSIITNAFSGDYNDLTNLPDLTVYETTANVDEKIANVLGSISTETLDTIGELANAINNDPDYFNTISSGLDAKANTADLSTVATTGSYNDLADLPIATAIERFKVNYATDGSIQSISDVTGGVVATVTSPAGGLVEFTFTGYNYPPTGILIYGYARSTNEYVVTPVTADMTTRKLAGGGTAGAPTAFGALGTSKLTLKLAEADTGASRSFGTTTHAWVMFTMIA